MAFWKWVRLRFGKGNSSKWIRVQVEEEPVQEEQPNEPEE